MTRIKTEQVGGTHYLDLPIQPWTIIHKCNLNFWEGTILSYLLRRKGGKADRITDLKKAAHTLKHYIWLLEKEGK